MKIIYEMRRFTDCLVCAGDDSANWAGARMVQNEAPPGE
jgi:hypothetical protein